MYPSPRLPAQTHVDDDSYPKSHFQSTVCLYDWWLVRPEEGSDGKALAVAGSTSQKMQSVQKPMRIFKSAPIAKIYDFSTLETSDGVCVILKGCINKSRTTDNGFSLEVFNHFALGFPYDWEERASRCLEKIANGGIDLGSQASVCKEKIGKEPEKMADTNSTSKMKSSNKTKATLEGTPFTPPDSFNRSRSGRILLPRLEFWRNQVVVYDVNGEVAGVLEGHSSTPDAKGRASEICMVARDQGPEECNLVSNTEHKSNVKHGSQRKDKLLLGDDCKTSRGASDKNGEIKIDGIDNRRQGKTASFSGRNPGQKRKAAGLSTLAAERRFSRRLRNLCQGLEKHLLVVDGRDNATTGGRSVGLYRKGCRCGCPFSVVSKSSVQY